MSVNLSSQEVQLLQAIRTQADELARMVHEASQAGFLINFNINAVVGACDRFDVFKTVPVDLRSSAN